MPLPSPAPAIVPALWQSSVKLRSSAPRPTLRSAMPLRGHGCEKIGSRLSSVSVASAVAAVTARRKPQSTVSDCAPSVAPHAAAADHADATSAIARVIVCLIGHLLLDVSGGNVMRYEYR